MSTILSPQSSCGVYPDGNRSIWILGMLITFKALGEETGGEYSMYEQWVPPGLGAPPHIHHEETEAFLMREGTVEFIKDDQRLPAESGDFVFVPKGVVHGFTNVGDVPARFTAISTPGGLHEKLLGEIGEPAPTPTLPPTPEAPPDIERLIEIGKKYGTEILRP